MRARAIVRRLARAAGSLGAAIGALAGCSLVTDLSGLSSGNLAVSPDAQDAQGTDAAPAADGSAEAGSDGPIEQDPYDPKYQRSFEITNPSTTETLPTGYTACFRGTAEQIYGTDVTTKVRADFADVRIYANGAALPRVLDELINGILSSCFRLVRPIAPGATDRSYTFRYGDANATPPPDASSDVFDFYDGFDGNTLASRWLKLGSPQVGGGVVTLPQGAQSGITTVAASDGIPVNATLELRVRVTNPATAGETVDGGSLRFYWFGFQHQGDFDAFEPWSIFVARSPSMINAEHKTAGACVAGCAQAEVPQNTDFRILKIDRTSTGALFTYPGGTTFLGVGGTGDMSIMIRTYAIASEVVVDWVRARPFVSPGPTAIVGAEVKLQ